MGSISEIPEILGLDCRSGLIRIPPETDVPLTPRVRQIIDSREFRRLAGISQLGLVSLVYPAAHHTRFEHSLGVYRLALVYLKQLSHQPRFAELVDRKDAELLIVAALLHDLGHWPFCHPIEDIRLPGVPQHEMFANSFLLEGEIADTLRDEWGINPRDVVAFLSEKPRDAKTQLLQSILSGPIDIDKMDYLPRDSLHAGVPYGRNFDQQRLIGSLTIDAAGAGLAITQKGHTAAEMMVFARYVMFSEVYWHHAVRGATAMLQRAFYLLYAHLDLDSAFRMSEAGMIAEMTKAAGNGPAAELLDGLFGPQRQIYKRLGQYSFFQERTLYDRLAGRPYEWLVACAEAFAELASHHVGRRVAPHEVIIDAPPKKREIEFRIEIYFEKEDCYRLLGDVSPVVRTLAQKQFDDCVKRVRVFGHARLAEGLSDPLVVAKLLNEAVDRTE
jgi:HD superfamily phosphohydrolase